MGWVGGWGVGRANAKKGRTERKNGGGGGIK